MHSAFYRLWHSSAGASAVVFHRSPRAKIYFITCSYLPRLKHRARANTRTHSQASGLMQANALGGSKAPLTLNEFAKGIRVSVWVCVFWVCCCGFFFHQGLGGERSGSVVGCAVPRQQDLMDYHMTGFRNKQLHTWSCLRDWKWLLSMFFISIIFYFIFLLCQTYVFRERCNNTKHPPVYHKIRRAPKQKVPTCCCRVPGCFVL